MLRMGGALTRHTVETAAYPPFSGVAFFPNAGVSRLRARPKGFAVIVAPLSTSAFGGLATGEASPFGNLRSLLRM